MHSSWPDKLGVLCILLLAVSLVAPTTALAATTVHVVTVQDGEFSPENLQVKKGDVVRWEWMEGNYTITSGESLDDEGLGDHFDLVLDKDHRAVEVTFDSIGDYPYFSRTAPDGMRGVISVLDATPVNRATWGFLKKMFENDDPLRRN